jgi:polysaccharide transporter, PST family
MGTIDDTRLCRPQAARDHDITQQPQQEKAPEGFIGKGSAVTLGGQGIKILLQFLSTAILGRLLTPADFGLMAMAAPVLTFFVIFRDLGLSNVAIQRASITAEEVSTLFWVNILAGVVLAIVVAALGPVAAAFFREDRLGPVLALLAVTFLINGASAQFLAMMQRRFRVRRLVLIDVCATTAGIAAGIVAAWRGFGFWSLVLVPIVTQSTSLLLALHGSHWSPGRVRIDRHIFGMIRTGAGFAGFNLFNFLSRNLDNILIGRTLGETALGYYSRAYNLMLIPLSQVTNPLAQVMVPALSRLVPEPALYRSTYIGALQKILFFCCPVIMANIVGADWTIRILLGPKWVEASPVYAILGIAAIVQPIGNSTGWLFISQGRSRDLFAWGVFSSVVTVASFVVGLHWGVSGLAWGYAAANIVILTPALCYWAGLRGPVDSRDLATATMPFLLVSALAGIAFQLVRQYWEPAPIVGLAGALAWHFSVQTALLLLYPKTRQPVREMSAVAQAVLGRLRVALSRQG